MTNEDRIKLFQKELGLIKNDKIRGFVEYALTELPESFFKCPASSSGKYHPAYALGEGGLVRHTKAAVAIANDLLSLDHGFVDSDIVIAALILHDGLKYGLQGEEHTIFEHPTLMAAWMESNLHITGILENYSLAKEITDCIRAHMGQWNRDKKGNALLPIPNNVEQRFVHMCDYLASRKYLEVNFDEIP